LTIDALVEAFPQIVLHELRDHMAQMTFPEEDEVIRAIVPSRGGYTIFSRLATQLLLGSRAASVSVDSFASLIIAPSHTLRISRIRPSSSTLTALIPRFAALPGLTHSKPPAVADPSTRRTPTPEP